MLVAPLAVVALIGTAACGSGGDGGGGNGSSESSRSRSINEIATKTRQADTAHISLTVAADNQVAQRINGSAQPSDRKFQFAFDEGDGSAVELVVIGYDGYQRSKPKQGAPGEWCAIGRVGGLNVDFGAILEALASNQGKLKRIGEGQVRGVQTTRYRIESTDATWNGSELWVDKDGLLRRLVQRFVGGGVERVDTAEFYDFGVKMSPITAPPAKKACPPEAD